MLKITVPLIYLYKNSEKDLSFSQLAKSILVNYVVMDTKIIVLWVSFCVRNMNVTLRLCFGSILKLHGKLIKVSSSI